MAQNVKVPKTITVNVDNESYNHGYDDAYDSCYQNQKLYLGHTAYYWENLAIDWMPFIVIIAALLFWGRKRRNKYWQYVETSQQQVQKSLTNQEKLLEGQAKTNVLLQQLVERSER